MSAGPQDFVFFAIHHCCQWLFPLQQSQMAEQGRIVIPATGAIGRKGQLTNNAVKLHNTTYTASHGEDDEWDSPEFQHKSHWFAFKFGFWQTILLYLSQTQTGWDSLLISGVPVRQALHQTTDQLYITGLVWTTLTTLSLRKCQDTFSPRPLLIFYNGYFGSSFSDNVISKTCASPSVMSKALWWLGDSVELIFVQLWHVQKS